MHTTHFVEFFTKKFGDIKSAEIETIVKISKLRFSLMIDYVRSNTNYTQPDYKKSQNEHFSLNLNCYYD
ncbi:MAG: hypothetical protein HeimC2_03410 [Candidatus Heimdallarchaeota archaeon LC_2]|nr:MAG: hypothetical protein HeimC2_03410 [Candidatus Heimdallarchaeota archaeon LC_2]